MNAAGAGATVEAEGGATACPTRAKSTEGPGGQQEMNRGSIQGARRRKTIDLSQLSAVNIRPFDDNPLTPWVVEPVQGGDVDLAAWATEGRQEVERLLLDRGAILFRGFGLTSAG